MTNKALTAERSIDNSCRKLGLTAEGKAWVDYALDPFKDLIKPHAGYPDKDLNPSVTEVVKQSVVVTRPASVASGNWDCLIFLDQAAISRDHFSTPTGAIPSSLLRVGQSGTAYKRGGLVVRSGAPGATLDTTTTQNALCLGVDAALYNAESCRVISLGFEVHDTSNILEKQGSLVPFRVDKTLGQPTSFTTMEDNGVTACIPTAYSGPTLNEPPKTLAAALDLPGSRQWLAKDGVYVVPVMVEDQNPALAVGANNATYTRAVDTSVYAPAIASAGANRHIYVNGGYNVSWPWSMSGVFIAGLHQDGEVTINFNYIIERFPSATSPIKRLCFPSPAYDEAALSLYGEIAPLLPTGVPVNENGFADWIKGISGAIASVASKIPHPLAQAVAGGAFAVNQVTKTVTEKMPFPEVVSEEVKLPIRAVITAPTKKQVNPPAKKKNNSAKKKNVVTKRQQKRAASNAKMNSFFSSDSPWAGSRQRALPYGVGYY